MSEAAPSPVHAVSDPSALGRLLATHDVACPGCGYNLRGLTGTACPECNSPLRLRVALAEPKWGAFIAGLLLISGSLGFCVLVLIFAAAVHTLARGGPRVAEMIPLIVGGLSGGAMLWFWLKIRRRLASRDAVVRWMLVAAILVGSLVCPAIFLLTVR